MKNKELIVFKSEHCLMCGDEIPEGRQVCQNCEKSVLEGVSTYTEKTCISPKKIKRKNSRFFSLFKKADK